MITTNAMWELVKWRFLLMKRQKLVLASLLLGVVGLLASFVLASSSYLWPEKVYWDFVLGIFFVFAVFLGSFVSSNLFSDEKQRRTLHLVLASGVSRRTWFWGNFLGVCLSTSSLLVIWSLMAVLMSCLLPTTSSSIDMILIAQAQLALIFEMLILISMAMGFSLFLRPILALLLVLVLGMFLHSQVSLVAILADVQTGAFNKPMLQPFLQWIVPMLPPLEWFDLRVLVGYESAVSAWQMFLLFAMSIGWAIFWMELGLWKFRKIDL